MAKLTGRIYKERYAPGQIRNNSFYEEQKNDTKIGDEYIIGMIGESETIRLNNLKVKCINCNKELGEHTIRTFATNLKGYDKNGKRKLFCSKECYEQYKKQFEVEVYNGHSIYAVECSGEVVYMPYWFSNYYFNNIKDCRKRIDMNNIGTYFI